LVWHFCELFDLISFGTRTTPFSPYRLAVCGWVIFLAGWVASGCFWGLQVGWLDVPGVLFQPEFGMRIRIINCWNLFGAGKCFGCADKVDLWPLAFQWPR